MEFDKYMTKAERAELARAKRKRDRIRGKAQQEYEDVYYRLKNRAESRIRTERARNAEKSI